MTARGRWTEKDFAKFNTGKVTGKSIVVKNNDIELAASKKRKASRDALREAVITSIKQSNISGTNKKEEFFEVCFEGARLLSVNDLYFYASNPFKGSAYKKAWHQAAEWAVLVIAGGPRNVEKFDWFVIDAHIQTKRKTDTDAKEGQLKYLIDGLTHAGVIVDDGPKYFAKWGEFSQTVGTPFVKIRVRKADREEKQVSFLR